MTKRIDINNGKYLQEWMIQMDKKEKTLLEEWRNFAYSYDINTKNGQMFWMNYFNMEKGVYEQLLANPDEVVKGTVEELAAKYDMELKYFVGFLDGINDSLKEANPIETMTKDTEVSLDFDNELLYKNMVAANAEWLYNLEQWNDIFSEEKRKELYKEQKRSTTIVKEKKIGRNEPCPCGSGKKYKHCCGRQDFKILKLFYSDKTWTLSTFCPR